MKKLIPLLLLIGSCNGSDESPQQRNALLAPVIPGRNITLKQGWENGVEILKGAAASYADVDTMFLKGTYGAIDLAGLSGRSPERPLVICPDGNSLVTKRLNLDGCKNIKIDGRGYKLVIEGHPYLRMSGGHGIDIFNNSANIEITGVYIHNKTTGVHVTSPVYCAAQDSLNRKGGGGQTNIYIHHNKIIGMFYEGMYISTTSPNNHNNDPRYNEACSNYRPEPARAKDVRVLYNIVDSTGRGGIQFGAVDGIAEIGFNTVSNSGWNGNDAQGTNISIGVFTHAWIHDNTCSKAFTNNIALLGGSAKVENNKLSGDYSLNTPPYSAIEQKDLGQYDVSKIPVVTNNAAALYGNQTSAIYITTRPSIFKDATRNETRGYMDSASFQVINNSIPSPKRWAVWVEDGYSMMKKTGNCISGQTNFGLESQIKYSTACSVTPVPVDTIKPPPPPPPIDTIKPTPPPVVVTIKKEFTLQLLSTGTIRIKSAARGTVVREYQMLLMSDNSIRLK